MATVNFSVGYCQTPNTGVGGVIEFNGVWLPASGRMDNIGDSVSADTNLSDIPGCPSISVNILCNRVSNSTMDVTVTFGGFCNGFGYGSLPPKVILGVALTSSTECPA